MTAVAMSARRELLRFFRSREAVWIVAGVGGVLALPLLMAILAPVSGAPEIGEITRNMLGWIEAVFLALLGYHLSERSLQQEDHDGSWLLLCLTPVPVGRPLLGKALGVAGVIASVHGFAAGILLCYTPFLRRAPLEVWIELVAFYLLALSFIPEGFAYASIGRRARQWLVFCRVGTLVRLAIVVLLFEGASSRQLAVTSAPVDVVLPPAARVRLIVGGGMSAGAAFSDPNLPWLAVFLWLAVSGVAIWHFLVVRSWDR